MSTASIPDLYFDGQFIDVLWDNHENVVKWFLCRLLDRDQSGKFAIMALKLNHHEEDSLWVIERKPEESYTGRVDGQVQPVCWIQSRDDFFRYHRYLRDDGIETSEIGGFITKGMVSFHFYDPDGNRLNISSM